jgi:tetratricopeptide (TPR) repeat protein
VQEARACFEQAYATAVPNDLVGLAADAAHMLSMMLPFDDARVWVDRGMTLAERSSDPTIRHWVGVIMNNWGGRLDEQGDHQGAALAFERALAARRLEGDASVTRESEFELAVQLRKLGSAAQALSIQQRLQQEALSAREPVGAILVEQVEILLALNRKPEAKQAAEAALHALTDEGAPAGQIDHLRTVLKELSNVDPR